ncbi:hypothetical protein NC99_08140 [Sunxiuqinia dokdonensis]|uniref:Uncharacterized protein n=1 Tax=Sunxiuqinia dokdonensis TaxID=1409788 RepID=A0A0L8VDE8_9BACT|nr:hypothetical protein NC99_08140 [Sunxiuqinia dokdonensis]
MDQFEIQVFFVLIPPVLMAEAGCGGRGALGFFQKEIEVDGSFSFGIA